MKKYNKNSIKLNDAVKLIRGVHSGRTGRVTKVYRKMCIVVLEGRSTPSVRKSLRFLCKVKAEVFKSHAETENKNMCVDCVEVTPEKECRNDHLDDSHKLTSTSNKFVHDVNIRKTNIVDEYNNSYDTSSVSSGQSSISDEVTLPYFEYNGVSKDFINSMIDHSLKMLVSLLKLKKKENADTNIDGYLMKTKVLVKKT